MNQFKFEAVNLLPRSKFLSFTCNKVNHCFIFIRSYDHVDEEFFRELLIKTSRAVEENKDNGKVEIYSQRVRAGKRTYFFDVKATRSNDYYLTITESKRKYKDDGYYYEKHKIFLYKEDFNKFIEALNGTVDHVKTELLPDVDFTHFDRDKEHKTEETDLGSDLKWD